jgi:hypothetical protein
MGFSRYLTGDYTLLDTPGAGVTVIWSWTMHQPRSALAGNEAFVDDCRSAEEQRRHDLGVMTTFSARLSAACLKTSHASSMLPSPRAERTTGDTP